MQLLTPLVGIVALLLLALLSWADIFLSQLYIDISIISSNNKRHELKQK